MKEYEKEYYAFQTQARGLLSKDALRLRFEKLRRWYRSRLGDFLPTDRNAPCLDIPCGYGNFLYFLESEGYSNVAGYDTDAAQVGLARLLELPASQGDAFEILSNSPDTYALISSLDFVEHLPKDKALRFLGMCYDSLMPGGCLILRTPSANGLFGSNDIHNDLTHQWGATSSLLNAILQMKGFEKIALLDERPQPSSIIDTLRWLCYFPTKLLANLFTMMLGMSVPDVWSRSMIAVAYKPGEMTLKEVEGSEEAFIPEPIQVEFTGKGAACKNFFRNWALALLYPRPLMGLKYIPGFFREMLRYRAMNSGEVVNFRDMHPCLQDKVLGTPFDPHYFYQGGWLSRRIHAVRPGLHVDVGSSVMMASVLSGGIKTIFVDYRPLHADFDGLIGIAADIVDLPFADDSVTSLSSLHVIEHIGLGRYGDSLNARGSLQAAAELKRVLQPGGRLYVSVPVGRARVCFNAHRIFSPNEVRAMFSDLSLVEFTFVDDSQRFHEDCELDEAADMEYACGMYVFEKQGVAD
ncbi:MAG: DUF268 domain-containing protein [Mariprofundaceae bacterium]|nr:DUF268 domain-containing protein [Mariprofundaceae bacterium]